MDLVITYKSVSSYYSNETFCHLHKRLSLRCHHYFSSKCPILSALGLTSLILGSQGTNSNCSAISSSIQPDCRSLVVKLFTYAFSTICPGMCVPPILRVGEPLKSLLRRSVARALSHHLGHGYNHLSCRSGSHGFQHLSHQNRAASSMS